MKEVVFKLVPTPSTALGDSTVAREPSKLFVSQTDLGIEVIVEGLAVEIELPVDMLDPLEEQTGSVGLNQERVDGAFEVGVLDTQKVVYRRDQPSSIFVHVRVHLDSDRHLVVTPAVPINLRDCRLFGLPARAVYDFKLVHSPSRASELATWLRHTPMNSMGDHERAGMFATRKLELYPEREPIKAITETISAHVQKGADDPSPPTVDFVFEDIVAPVGVGPTVPVGPGTLFPVPGHVTVGIRRPDPPPERPEESYLPSKAPVMLCWGGGSNFLGMLVESFFFQSLPLSVRDVGVHFNVAFYFDESGPDHQLTADLVENLTLRLGYRRGFSSWPGLPEPKAPGEQDVDALLHWEIADVVIDIVGVRVGFSFGKGRKAGTPEPPHQCAHTLRFSCRGPDA